MPPRQQALFLARRLLLLIGMTLTRHTQVENLANLLAARRRRTVAHAPRTDAYRRLVAVALQVPLERVDTSAAPAAAPLTPALPFQVAAQQAA